MYFLIFWIIKIICILISVAFFTIAERKVMASIQRRLGPNVEGGAFGLLQPIADGLKLFIKELTIPSHSSIFIFFFSPVLIFTLSMFGWSIISFSEIAYYNFEIFFENKYLNYSSFNKGYFFSDFKYSILFLLAISSLNVYGIILGGWSSNSKYAFLGSIRSSAQMISYEVSIGLTIMPVIILSNSFNFNTIIFMQNITTWFIFPLLPSFIIFLISMLAETNRAPFDLPEAEAELVAGYNVEYGSMAFALFFLGEYSSMILMSTIIVILFFGGWTSSFSYINNIWILAQLYFILKVLIFCCFFIIIRAILPRYRYDQLMHIGWLEFLPISFSFYFLVMCLVYVCFHY